MNRHLLALTAGMLLMGTAAAQAQTQSPNLNDDTQMLLSQIQADKAAVVLKSLELTDPKRVPSRRSMTNTRKSARRSPSGRSPSSTSSPRTTAR
jgi:hypothetical protein